MCSVLFILLKNYSNPVPYVTMSPMSLKYNNTFSIHYINQLDDPEIVEVKCRTARRIEEFRIPSPYGVTNFISNRGNLGVYLHRRGLIPSHVIWRSRWCSPQCTMAAGCQEHFKHRVQRVDGVRYALSFRTHIADANDDSYTEELEDPRGTT